MEDTTPRRGPGRPSHEPTETLRDLVRELTAIGRSVEFVALALAISEPTLRRHYAADLSASRPQLIFPFPEIDFGVAPPRRTNRGGRPMHIPTAELRERVEILVAGNMPAWRIAKALGISEPTLREHYEDELENGRSRKLAAMKEALFKAGVVEGNVSAMKAWLAQHGELDNPPPQAPANPPANQPLGKKDAAKAVAFTAEIGTEWEGLLPN